MTTEHSELAHARATMPQLRIDPDRLADLLDEIHDEADESAPERTPQWRLRFERD